jgi:hypothetical protein
MITETRLENALKFLSETDEKSAEASANVKYLDRLLKRKKALFITGEASLKSVSLLKSRRTMHQKIMKKLFKKSMMQK